MVTKNRNDQPSGKLKDKIKNKLTHWKKYFAGKPIFYIWHIFQNRVMRGFYLYSRVVEKYGTNYQLLLSLTGIGDAYIYGQIFHAYAKKNYPTLTPVFGVYGRAGFEVAELFGIEHIEEFSFDEFNRHLYGLLMFDTQQKTHMESMFYQTVFRHTLILKPLDGIHGFNIRSVVVAELGLDDEEKRGILFQEPVFNYNKLFLSELFEKNHLCPQKTILLAPYAKSVKAIPMSIWERIAEGLIQKGFCVCTNSVGAHEPPVLHTKPIRIPIAYSVPFVEMAGAVVGIRSGFLDVISSAKCPKFSIHPKDDYKRGVFCAASDYYSLTAMYGQPNQFDLIYTKGNEDQLIDSIVQQILEKLESAETGVK